tara:strand:+ start:718 stop:1275 length:558 start_codon:yes stop_codon:yes gene_type:complete
MIIIPCGIDCGLADLLNKHNLRHFSLPFDWSVSYGGVSEIIKNDFIDFIPMNNMKSIYSYSFIHNNFPHDTETMMRRCNRLLNLLRNTPDELVFIRKGHAFHHHAESNQKGFNLENDITDAEKLNIVLKQKYPHLNYKIIVVLVCGSCFDNIVYKSTNIQIYNIATTTVDNNKFEKILNEIISTL